MRRLGCKVQEYLRQVLCVFSPLVPLDLAFSCTQKIYQSSMQSVGGFADGLSDLCRV